MKDYYSLLICPNCKSNKLNRENSCFICEKCNSIFNDYQDKVALVADKDKRADYGKLLVTENNDEFWKKEAVWDKKFKELVPEGTGYLLDYACGGGQRRWCESKGYKYIGIDYYIDYGVDIIANGMNLPIKDNAISCVTSPAVMEHIPDPWLACKEIYRILRPGGFYIGSVAFLYPFHERSHYNMSHLGIKNMLEQVGFFVEKITPWKISGIEAIIKSMVGVKYVSGIIAFPFKIFTLSLMFFRQMAALLYLFIYKDDTNRRKRIKEFIDEEPLRFTSGFNYIAWK